MQKKLRLKLAYLVLFYVLNTVLIFEVWDIEWGKNIHKYKQTRFMFGKVELSDWQKKRNGETLV